MFKPALKMFIFGMLSFNFIYFIFQKIVFTDYSILFCKIKGICISYVIGAIVRAVWDYLIGTSKLVSSSLPLGQILCSHESYWLRFGVGFYVEGKRISHTYRETTRVSLKKAVMQKENVQTNYEYVLRHSYVIAVIHSWQRGLTCELGFLPPVWKLG